MKGLPHPIPYQGSKRRLAPVIGRYLPERTRVFYEPFSGSAAVTVYAAHHRRAERLVVADGFAPMITPLRSITEEPERTAARCREVWEGQREGDHGFFNEIRRRYNEERDPVDPSYLICRCVKNAVRFDGHGCFTQSVDKRRLGMHPDKMLSAMMGVSSILRGRTEFRLGDRQETSADARPDDFVYMDPPYLGTSIGRDKRHHRQIMREELVGGLENLRRRNVPFALSCDGMTGGREYGSPLPKSPGSTRLLLHAGTSSQSTLSRRNEETTESLYVTPGLAGSPGDVIRSDAAQVSLDVRPVF